MRKVTVSRMRERYAQTVLTFRTTYVYLEIPRHILHPMYMGENIKGIYITLRAGFEPVISASEHPQTHALDRAATGIGNRSY